MNVKDLSHTERDMLLAMVELAIAKNRHDALIMGNDTVSTAFVAETLRDLKIKIEQAARGGIDVPPELWERSLRHPLKTFIEQPDLTLNYLRKLIVRYIQAAALAQDDAGLEIMITFGIMRRS